MGFDLDGVFLPPSRPFPFVVQLKGVAADEARFERGWGAANRRTAALFERLNARRADRVVVPSRYSGTRAADHYGLAPEDVVVVPEGIRLEPWNEAKARARGDLEALDGPREGNGPESTGSPTILTVGRQYPRKNTRTLLDALPLVARRVPDVELRVAGGGPCLSALRRRARSLGIGERVTFLGAVASDRELRREYLRADCFCLPSLQEGFGIVFLEAMAAGLPIVAGRAGAVPEVVADGEVGLLVDPRDPAEIAGALVCLLTRRSEARALGAAGRARVRRYDAGRVAGRFLEAVRDLVEAPDRAGAGTRGHPVAPGAGRSPAEGGRAPRGSSR